MKGYPRSRFEVINQTQIQTINANTNNGKIIALYMQPYTSNKGTEDWELLTSLEGFTDTKGGMSFIKHGQAQLTVAQALRSGAYVLGKRMVCDDAKLANVTVRARVVKTSKLEVTPGNVQNLGDTSNVYLYTVSGTNCTTFEDACSVGYKDFDASAENVTDVPLFTVTPMGRGESLLFIRVNPEYETSKFSGSTCNKYSFEVIENNSVIESISITMNPNVIVNGVSQGINPRIKANSKQIRVKLYEDGIYKLVELLSETAVDKGNTIYPADLLNMDFINGYNRRGTEVLGGISTVVSNKGAENSVWASNMPEDIRTSACDLTSIEGIALSGGSYGEMTANPMSKPDVMEKMLLEVFGQPSNYPIKDNTDPKYGKLFDSIIYDLDAYKVDCIFDCNWPISVKRAIMNLAEFRGDLVFLSDLNTSVTTSDNIVEGLNTLSSIIEKVKKINFDEENNIQYYSNYTSYYHNHFKVVDPFTKKEITVTMPYKLIDKMTDHISKGVSRPFVGIANNLTFNDIIDGSINFFPVEIPGMDQKQELIENNVNYLSIYDGVPVMETMYVNSGDLSQLSYLHNIMAVQEIIKTIRTRCPRTRYAFLDGSDLENYISDVNAIIKESASNFKSISCEYMADEKYEQNNIFYAVLKVQFKNFIQEEYFKIIAIS